MKANSSKVTVTIVVIITSKREHLELLLLPESLEASAKNRKKYNIVLEFVISHFRLRLHVYSCTKLQPMGLMYVARSMFTLD